MFLLCCVSVQFRSLRVPANNRAVELLKHLHWKGEDACDEFYRALHIHAEDVYTGLPSRVAQRGISSDGERCLKFSSIGTIKWLTFRLQCPPAKLASELQWPAHPNLDVLFIFFSVFEAVSSYNH